MISDQADTEAQLGNPVASDVMTTTVLTVGPDMPVPDIARLLLDNSISAVPVIDGDGIPIGMVSEGDLIARSDTDRLARRDWWLTVISGKQPLDTAFAARIGVGSAGDVMSAPVITVEPKTGVGAIARLLSLHHIKRVPVVDGGRVIGIVSRADLLRVVASGRRPVAGAAKPGGFLTDLFAGAARPLPARPESAAVRQKGPLTIADFRHLEAGFHQGEVQEKADLRRMAAEQRQRLTAELIDTHVTDDTWRTMLHHARKVAEHGGKEDMVLRFPNALCLDGGRAINIAAPEWPSTLRGEAAEIYLRWERELKSGGFGISAHVLEFPDGKPGDIGLFLVWGE